MKFKKYLILVLFFGLMQIDGARAAFAIYKHSSEYLPIVNDHVQELASNNNPLQFSKASPAQPKGRARYYDGDKAERNSKRALGYGIVAWISVMLILFSDMIVLPVVLLFPGIMGVLAIVFGSSGMNSGGVNFRLAK